MRSLLMKHDQLQSQVHASQCNHKMSLQARRAEESALFLAKDVVTSAAK